MLERIVGRDITKPISQKEFHDVHYLRQMLYCTFKSLHQAQRKLAFHHADLRLANIMELVPEKHTSNPGTPRGSDTPKSGRMQDASHHDSQNFGAGLHANELASVNLHDVVGPQPAESQQDGVRPTDQQAAPAHLQLQDSVLRHRSSSVYDASDMQAGNFKVNQFLIAAILTIGLCIYPMRTLYTSDMHA